MSASKITVFLVSVLTGILGGAGWLNSFQSIQAVQEPEKEQKQEEEQEQEEDEAAVSDPVKLIQDQMAKLSGTTRTAEELLAKMGEPMAAFTAGEGELSDEEIAKAVELLRAKYPFESIRDRMSFQVQDSKPTQVQRDSSADQTESSQVEFQTFSMRANALAQLHSNEVNEFINRPGAGFMRSRSVSPYELPTRGRWANQIQSRSVDSALLGEPLVELKKRDPNSEQKDHYAAVLSLSKNGMPTLELTEYFHGEASRGFVSPPSLGLVKSLDEVTGFESHRMRFDEKWNGSIRIASKETLMGYSSVPDNMAVDWKVNRLQLVSLLLHDEPRVYVAENLPNMEELSGADVETRALSDFEVQGLEKLRQGKQVVTAATPNRLQMIGALRAKAQCMQCHDVKENELLGAFSYEFLRSPQVEVRSTGL